MSRADVVAALRDIADQNALLFRMSDACRVLDVGPSFVYNEIHHGRIEFEDTGHTIRFTTAWLIAFIEQQKREYTRHRTALALTTIRDVRADWKR